LCVYCVRFFCFYIVSSETASRPKKRLTRTYHWISLFMSYKVSKLAYRIWVILIANERVTKKNLLSIYATFLAHLILLDLMILIIICEEWKLRSSSFGNFLQHVAISLWSKYSQHPESMFVP
jgi:hypothetical protein